MTVCAAAGSQAATHADAITADAMPPDQQMFTSGKSKRTDDAQKMLTKINLELVANKQVSEDTLQVVKHVQVLHARPAPATAPATAPAPASAAAAVAPTTDPTTATTTATCSGEQGATKKHKVTPEQPVQLAGNKKAQTVMRAQRLDKKARSREYKAAPAAASPHTPV